ncbi:hypothetical protein VTN96DRAFT_922 [Rasamsonia emersonii]
MSAFRFLIPTSRLQGDPALEKLLQWKSPGATIFADTLDKAHERHLVWYPCQGGDVQNVVGIHPTRPNAAETDFKASLLDEFRYFNPDVVKLLELAEDVKCWKLARYEPFPRWTRKDIVLVGDAAHPMLPFGAQAANQAIEDGAALGQLLRGVDDAAEIPHRLQLFEDIRRRRTAIIQILSSARIGREGTVTDKLREFVADGESTVSSCM